MAKPIKSDRPLSGKAAKRFVEQFLTNVKHDPDKVERDTRALGVYRNTKVVY